jgi:hypothetical protein
MNETMTKIEERFRKIPGVKNVESGLQDFGYKHKNGTAYGDIPYIDITYASESIEKEVQETYNALAEGFKKLIKDKKLTFLYRNPDATTQTNKRNIIFCLKGDKEQKAITWKCLDQALENSQ